VTEGLFLSQGDRRPMYQQIIEQIKLKIMAGDWPPGFALPSIRELAASTRVSVITVKHAYRALEQQGLVTTRQGRGSFVSETAQQDQLRESELNRHVDALLDQAKKLGMQGDEILQLIRSAVEKHKL
jgi:GntR family transcriptional regulator